VKEAMNANSTVSFQNALVLAALNVSEELMLLKKTLASELTRVEDRTRKILDHFEDATSTTN
jgi:cell division protein ZapA (FtsZ GTPase activity inhibitor)